jgi:hypothetical protein
VLRLKTGEPVFSFELGGLHGRCHYRSSRLPSISGQYAGQEEIRVLQIDRFAAQFPGRNTGTYYAGVKGFILLLFP